MLRNDTADTLSFFLKKYALQKISTPKNGPEKLGIIYLAFVLKLSQQFKYWANKPLKKGRNKLGNYTRLIIIFDDIA